MDIQFDYNDTISTINTANSRTSIVNSEANANSYNINHSKDFYRGRSFRYAGKWSEGVHYINDDYIVDFVVKDNFLLVCTKSHISSLQNEPSDWVEIDSGVYGVASDYWDVVVAGNGGGPIERKVYIPSYDLTSDTITWTLLKPTEEILQTDINLNRVIDQATSNINVDLNAIKSSINAIRDDVSSNRTAINAIETSTDGIRASVDDLSGDFSILELTTTHIATRVEDVYGNYSAFRQTAEGFFFKIENIEGDVGSLWLTASEFGVRMSNAENDVAQLTIRADEISTSVENAKGDLSQMHQRADEIWTQVENAQGDISRISQRADVIQSTVENAQHDVSRIEQRADQILSQVENAQGDLSQIIQRADLIEQTVRANKVESDTSILEMESRIRQTAQEISSEVFATTTNINDSISALNSRVTQQAGLIEQKVSQTDYNLKTTELEQSVASIDIKADNIRQSVERSEGRIESTASALSDYIIQTDGLLDMLLNQADGAIDTWFYEGAPTLSNIPASDWSSDTDKNEHLGDLYYDKLTGKAYRFVKDNNTYAWIEIADDALSAALALAAEAKDTADGKRRIFVREPVPPYDEGDLWVQGHIASGENANNGMIYRCIHSKASGLFDSADWEVAFDMVTIKKAKAAFDIFADAIEGTVWEEDGNGIITSNTYSRVKQTVDTINLHIENTKSALRATGIDITGVQFDQYGQPISGGSVVITADNFKIQANDSNVQDALVITLVDGHPKISASSLEINGIFSTAPGSTWLQQAAILKDYADTKKSEAISAAASNATTYITNNVIPQITSVSDNVDGLNYLKTALWDGDTAVAGGLIVSSLIQLGSKTYNNTDTPIRNINGTTTSGELNQSTWKVWSGLNGVYDSSALGHGIAAWYGGEMRDRGVSGNNDANRAAKTLFRFDGSGYLANNNIYWDSFGNIVINGYVLTNEIQLKDNNGNIKSGISGQYNASDSSNGYGIAAWFGGPKVDKKKEPNASNYAKSLFRFDGSGYLANRQLEWGANGELIIHGQSTESPITIENAVLSQGNLSITIGDLLELKSWFTKEEYTPGHYRLKFVGSQTGIEGLYVEGYLITTGDQIIGSGTPGQGIFAGGARNLYDLEDVYSSNGNVLRADGSSRHDGDLLSFDNNKGKWVALDSSTISSTFDGSDYVAKAGDVMSGTSANILTINTTNATYNYLLFQHSGVTKGSIGTYPSVGMIMTGDSTSWFGVLKNNGGIRYYDGTTQQTVYHSGNFNPSNYVSKAGDSMSGTLSVPELKLTDNGTTRAQMYADSGGFVLYHTGTGIPQLKLYPNTNYPVFRYSGTDYAILHAGNASISSNTISVLGTVLGNSNNPIAYATNATNANYINSFSLNSAFGLPYKFASSTVTGSGTWYVCIKSPNWINNNWAIYARATGDNWFSDLVVNIHPWSPITYWGYQTGYNGVLVNGIATEISGGNIYVYLKVSSATSIAVFSSTDNITVTKGDYSSKSYNPLSRGFFSTDVRSFGDIVIPSNGKTFSFKKTNNGTNVDIGWDYSASEGAGIGLRSSADSDSGSFCIFARNSSSTKRLIGKVDGTLTWNDNTIWHSGNTGSGSGLNADYVDGKHADAFLLKTGGTLSGTLYSSVTSGAVLQGANGEYLDRYLNMCLSSSSGSWNIKDDSSRHILTVYRDHSSNPAVVINSYRTSGYVKALNLLAPSLSAGTDNVLQLAFGVGTSTNNCGELSYYHVSGGSTNNYISLGIYGVGAILKAYPAGDVYIGKSNAGSLYIPYGNMYLNNAGASGNRVFGFKRTNSNTNIDVGWDYTNVDGAGAFFRASDASSDPGAFGFFARSNSSNQRSLTGKTDGTLTWGGTQFLVNSPANEDWNEPIRGLCSNLTATHKMILRIGKAANSMNCGGLQYYHVGDGNTMNTIALGMYGLDFKLCLRGNGNVDIGYSETTTGGQKLNVNGNILSTGDLSCRAISTSGYLGSTQSYNEGIRMHSVGTWTTLAFCDSANTGDSGTSANTWTIHNNEGKFYINRNGSNTHTKSEFCNVAGRWLFGAVTAPYTATWCRLQVYNDETGDGMYIGTTSTWATICYKASAGAMWSVGAENTSGFQFWNNSANGAVAKISTAGVFTTTGDQVVSSDATLKENWRDLAYGVAEIAKAPVGTFEWKDGRGRSAGTTAQYWKTLLPELVHGEEGSMTLAYGQVAMVNSILNAKAIMELNDHETKQDKEIKKLKKRVLELEEEVKRLRN